MNMLDKMGRIVAIIILAGIILLFTFAPVGVGVGGNIAHRVMVLALGFIAGYVVGYGEDKN